MPLSFGVTYDYRCPFARIAHEHVLVGLADGADWDVRFIPVSQVQMQVEDGPDVWDEPSRDRGLLALQAGVAVRDLHPERFVDVHRALFEARHSSGLRLADEDDIRKVLESEGLDADEVLTAIDGGGPLVAVRDEHRAAVSEHGVWGVPTFIGSQDAVFVRLMERPSDPADARRTVERIVGLLDGWPELNEFKRTRVHR